MNRLIALLFLLISADCYSQSKTEVLVGNWKYINTTNLQDSIIESSVKEFELEIASDGTFGMNGEEIRVTGTWKLIDSTLVLEGKRNDEDETKIQKMKIKELLENKLSIEMTIEGHGKALMNLHKMK